MQPSKIISLNQFFWTLLKLKRRVGGVGVSREKVQDLKLLFLLFIKESFRMRIKVLYLDS